jgi:hypothetical protein
MQRRPRTLISLAAARRARSRRGAAFAFVVALLGCAASVASPPAAAAHASPGAPATASRPSEVALPRAPRGPSALVTMAPVGLSFEYSAMAQDLGAGPCPPPALATELVRLGSPPLSLAGDSQDMTVPSGALSGPPASWEAATLFTLPAAFWSQLHCLLSASNDPLTVGLNAKTGQLAWAQQMVAGAQSAATNGLDFSIGNEPDLFSLPNYAALAKPQADEEAAAVDLYLQVAASLVPAIAGAPLIGPELAVPGRWRGQLSRVIAQLHEQIVGVHAYPLSACVTPRAVTIGGLLAPGVGSEPRAFGWVVADADAAGVPAIISEANSASCGGRAGVSDSPASAVWAVRFVLSALQTGFKEVRFHFSGDPYDPFVVRGDEVLDRPMESALVALNQWLPVGSTLQSVGGLHGLVGTAVSGGPTAARLIVDNEQPRAQTIVLRTTNSVRVQVLGAARAGLQTTQLSPRHRRVKLRVAANSVLAVLPAGVGAFSVAR